MQKYLARAAYRLGSGVVHTHDELAFPFIAAHLSRKLRSRLKRRRKLDFSGLTVDVALGELGYGAVRSGSEQLFVVSALSRTEHVRTLL